MRTAVFTAPHYIEIDQQSVAKLGPGEVLVAVQATGICAGDMYIYQGKNPYAQYPIIGGHEISGVVAEVGEGVTGIDIGAQVVVEPFIGCGNCYPCRVGKPNCCANLQIIGVHRPGGFAEFVTAPAPYIYRVPAGLSPLVASFAEPVAIGVQACRRGEVTAADDVLILGCGPIWLGVDRSGAARAAPV